MCGLNLLYNCFSIPIVVVNICQVVLQALNYFSHFILSSGFLDSKFCVIHCPVYVLCIKKNTVHFVTLTYSVIRTLEP